MACLWRNVTAGGSRPLVVLQSHKDNALFLSSFILNSEEVVELLGKDWKDFHAKAAAILANKSGPALHEAVEALYALCLEHPRLRQTATGIMASAQSATAVDAIATAEEMEALRDTLLRRLSNVNGNLVRSDSDASSGSGGGSSDDTKPAKHGFMAIPIMFATNRKMVGGTRVGHVYGTSRGDKLAFGCMWVSVPDLLMYGSEDTTTWRWSRNRHGAPRNKLVKLSTVTLQSCLVFTVLACGRAQEETCFHKLQQAMRAMQEKEAIVFVHGYNTSLSNATHRMAQVVYTANFRGTALVFSWPSNQSMAAYTADEANAMWAISDFVHVLKCALPSDSQQKPPNP
eukprot:SM001691S02739  [mRNA]  locus=s1691:3:1958:- [translate_table: standard]